jgi:hypothetical protein
VRWKIGRSRSNAWVFCRPCRSGYTSDGAAGTHWLTTICLYTPLVYVLLEYGDTWEPRP